MIKENKKILIIGASSNLGYAISNILSNNRDYLIGTYYKKYPLNPECYNKLVKINLLNLNSINNLSKYLKNITDILFLVGETNFLNKKKDIKSINYITLKNLINFFLKTKYRPRIIFYSSTAVFGKNSNMRIEERSNKLPLTTYGKSKLSAEKYLSNSKIPYIIIRSPIIFGSSFSNKFIRLQSAVQNNKVKIFGNGKNYIPYLAEADLISATSLLIRSRIINVDINLSSGSITQKEYWVAINHIFGKDVNFKKISLKNAFKEAKKQWKNYIKNNMKPSLLMEDVYTLSRNRIYDCKKALKLINWKPNINFETTVKETFNKNRISHDEGVRILKYLFGRSVLPFEICRQVKDLDQIKLHCNNENVWSVTIRKEGVIICSKHLFSKDFENILNFVKQEGFSSEKIAIIRISPPREKILYYGSYLLDLKNFKNKILITISKKNNDSTDLIKNEKGHSFKLLPRDLNVDLNIEINKESYDYSGNENIFEELLYTVNYATLGQITNVLYEVGGKYRRNM